MYMQFEDEKPLDPKRLKFYDGLFVANVLSPSSASKPTFVVAELTSNSTLYSEETAVVREADYSKFNFTTNDSRWTSRGGYATYDSSGSVLTS